MARNQARQQLFDVSESYRESLKQERISRGENPDPGFLESEALRQSSIFGIATLLTLIAGWSAWRILNSKGNAS